MIPSALRPSRAILSACCLILTCVAPAAAITIDFNGGALTINDNGPGDTNATLGILDFNSVIGGSYIVQGTVDTGSGTNLSGMIAPITASVRLTNFTAEAIGVPINPLAIQFFDTVPGVYNGVIAADSLDAYVDNSFNNPVPPGTDNIIDWQGFISGATITNLLPGPPPFPNPALPANSPPLPYTVVTHGPTLFTPIFTNPVIGAFLTFQLGASGDQLILQTSGEVGFAPVPEPASLALACLGALGLFFARKFMTPRHC